MVITSEKRNRDDTRNVKTTISFGEVEESMKYYGANPLGNYHNIWKERYEMLLNFAKGEGIGAEETCLIMCYMKLENGRATESVIVPSRK